MFSLTGNIRLVQSNGNWFSDRRFPLITGDTGPGKSVTLRLLAERHKRERAVSLSVLTYASSRAGNIYREMENHSSAVSAVAELLAATVSQERIRLSKTDRKTASQGRFRT